MSVHASRTWGENQKAQMIGCTVKYPFRGKLVKESVIVECLSEFLIANRFHIAGAAQCIHVIQNFCFAEFRNAQMIGCTVKSPFQRKFVKVSGIVKCLAEIFSGSKISFVLQVLLSQSM